MANLFLLVLLPLVLGGAIIAVFMYCCQYLLTYLSDYANKFWNSLQDSDSPKRSSK